MRFFYFPVSALTPCLLEAYRGKNFFQNPRILVDLRVFCVDNTLGQMGRAMNPETKPELGRAGVGTPSKARPTVQPARSSSLSAAQRAMRRERQRRRRALNPEKCREYRRQYYASHREKSLEANRLYRAANPEKRREADRRYKATHQEQCLKSGRKYDTTHREKRNEYRRKWRAANRDKFRKSSRKWRRSAKPEKGRARNQRYRFRKCHLKVETFTDLEIFERDGWLCGICGQKINRRLKWPHPRSKSLDHIVPLLRGGGHARENVQAAHLRCNMSKHTGGGGQLRLIG